MKYFVILVRTNTEDVITKSMYDFETEAEAIASFHSNLGAAMKDKTIKHCLCMAINSIGGVVKIEPYVREEAND